MKNEGGRVKSTRPSRAPARSSFILHPSSLFVHRPGYSFAEILFAVAILGVGFIMVAAMFPVAIHQSKTTVEESNAANIVRTAVRVMNTIATNANMPATTETVTAQTVVVPFSDGTTLVNGTPIPHGNWDAIRAQLIEPSDPHFAFIPLYRRELNSNTAQVWFFIVHTRERSNDGDRYGVPDVTMGYEGHPDPNYVPAPVAVPPYYPWLHANLQPRPVTVTVVNNPLGDGVDELVVRTDLTTTPPNPDFSESVVEGAYILIADAGTPPLSVSDPVLNHEAIGRLYKIGRRRTDRDAAHPDLPTAIAATREEVWELQAGNDLNDADAVDVYTGGADTMAQDVYNATAYVIGRSMVRSGYPRANTDNAYEGVAQDIAVYTSFIQVTP